MIKYSIKHQFRMLAWGAAVFLSLGSGLIAQTSPNPPNPPLWLVTCSNQIVHDKLTCSMSQTIFRDKPRQRILGINVFRDQPGSVSMRAQLPHGLNLTKGIELSIDGGKVMNYPIWTTDANGAYATIAMSPEMIIGLKAGNKLVVTVHDLSGNRIQIEVNLQGFSKSFDLMS